MYDEAYTPCPKREKTKLPGKNRKVDDGNDEEKNLMKSHIY
jgi:hypothetical protein